MHVVNWETPKYTERGKKRYGGIAISWWSADRETMLFPDCLQVLCRVKLKLMRGLRNDLHVLDRHSSTSTSDTAPGSISRTLEKSPRTPQAASIQCLIRVDAVHIESLQLHDGVMASYPRPGFICIKLLPGAEHGVPSSWKLTER